MPVSPKAFEYQFSPSALKRVRDRLGLSQAKLAERLDLPVNTVSRWERGETTPDANSLAAIYSIAKDQGLETEFFQKGGGMVSAKKQKKSPTPLNGRRVLNKNRARVVMLWDFQNVALDADSASEVWFYMARFLPVAFPNVKEWELKVYASWEHRSAVQNLIGFKTEQPYSNADAQIKQDARRLCGVPEQSHFMIYGRPNHDPKSTIFVLVSKDGDFANLISDARQAGVDVYLWAPPGCSKELASSVNRSNIIPWHHPCITVSEDNLKLLRK